MLKSQNMNKRKLTSVGGPSTPTKRRLVSSSSSDDDGDALWQHLGYKSKRAFEKAEREAEKAADDDDGEWKESLRNEKKSEEKYKALSFEQKTKKLNQLLNKAGKFADFLRSETDAQTSKEEFEQPSLMTGGKEKLKLRSYQQTGAQWLNSLVCNGMSGILADEMGLGKTIQVIALAAHLKSIGVRGRMLVVAPLSTLPNWAHEFERWCPSMDVVLYHGNPQERAQIRHERLGFTKPAKKGGTNNRRQRGKEYLKRVASDVQRMSYKELMDMHEALGMQVPKKTSKQKARENLLGVVKTGDPEHLHRRLSPIVITSYGMILRDIKHFRQMNWFHVTIDEGHRLKNKDCRLMHELKSLRSEHRLLLTGTPLQNNITELWSLLHFLRPDIFESAAFFKAWFGWDSRDENMKEQICDDTEKGDIVSKLHRILHPFMLRRLKRDVAKNLPSKTEVVVYVGMTDGQRELYDAIVKDMAGLAKQLREANCRGAGGGSLLNKLMQLRKCCNHPYLFADSDLTDEQIVLMSGKIVVLDKMLKSLFKNNHKVLIFSQFTKMLDILEDYFFVRGWERNVCRIDGSVHFTDRQAQIDGFNDEVCVCESNPSLYIYIYISRLFLHVTHSLAHTQNSDKNIFLLSTRAGGVGINLASADTVIIFDSDWNPHMDNQAQDRAHRIGQKRDVFVYRFVVEGSVELKILERANNKRSLERLTMAGNFAGDQTKEKEEIKSMRLEAVQEILQDDISVSAEQREGRTGGITDDELRDILDRKKILAARKSQHKSGAKKNSLLKSTGYEVVEHKASGLGAM